MASGNKKEPTDSECVALHDRLMDVVDKQGHPIQVPALSKGFVEPIYWLKYRPARIIFTFDELMSICADGADGLAEKYDAEIDEWLQRMFYIADDLTKMLRIPHNRFWSHALYDDGFHQLLESYLRLAPRYTALHRYLITKQMEEAENRVHNLVFRNFLRLSTNKESKLNFIDRDKFADVIYDNFIFDIPKIMDVCTIFSRGNHDLVRRMINHIMTCQPKFTSDLKDTEDTLLLALERAESSIKSPDEVGCVPRRLDDEESASELRKMPFWKLLERIHYVVDIAASQATFFEIYPSAAKFFTLENVGHRLAKFFDGTFPLLKEELVHRNNLESFEPVFSLLKKRLSYAKSCVLKIFRTLLQSQCLEPLQELGQEKQANGLELPYLEAFFGVMCNCLTEKYFIVAYQQRYPVEEDISMFDQYNFFVDNTRALYIIQSMCTIYSELGSAPPSNLLQAQETATLPRRVTKVPPFQVTNGLLTDSSQAADSSAESGYEGGACGGEEEEEGACGGAEAPSEVHYLRELFPNLSEDFLQECLKYYNYDRQEVVMALLDNNLPPSLSERAASASLEAAPPSFEAASPSLEAASPSLEAASPSLEAAPLSTFEPRSIYDNDEFDILRRDDIDISRIHIGKKSKTPKSLDDQGHEKVLKEVYQKYSIVHEVVDSKGLYEDEYDDTYDSNDVGLAEPAPEDELSTRRPFTMPRVLEPRQGRRNENRYEDQEDQFNEPEGAPPRDQFVPNPAEIREQRERRYREKMERSGAAPRRRDFKGGARGQGQPQEVLRDRQFKERNKSTFTHNQRAQADHKRSRGMYS